jgi:hypothetical protein
MLGAMNTPDDSPAVDPPGSPDPQRWTLIRDALAFQFKLLADALRDLLLSPVSLILAISDLIDPGRDRFYRLMELGRTSDRWIDLFGAGRRAEPDDRTEAKIDEVVARIEQTLRTRYAEGGLTAQIVEKIDRSLDSVQPREKQDP